MTTTRLSMPRHRASCACSRVWPPGLPPTPMRKPDSNPPGEPSTTSSAASARATPALRAARQVKNHPVGSSSERCMRAPCLRAQVLMIIWDGMQAWQLWMPGPLIAATAMHLVQTMDTAVGKAPRVKSRASQESRQECRQILGRIGSA